MIELNQRVCLIRNHKIKGKIISIIEQKGFEVIWDNGDIEIIRENEIQPEIINQTPWERLANNEFTNFYNYSISSIVSKVKNVNLNCISTLKASRTIFKPFQFIPLLKFLNSENRRIIVADEVGLGKTISAGHIILELIARGELKNLLVVCLNSIQDKWIDDLQDKFNIRLKQFETLKDFKTSIERYEIYNENIFGVINYEKFRNKESSVFFENIKMNFDLIVLDEAHTLRNKNTNTSKSLKNITDNANGIVMLTATPIMTSLENLYNLIKLLDEENFSNYQIFHNTINLNKPFLLAYNKLHENIDTKEIAAFLENSNVESLFKYGKEEFKNYVSLSEQLKNDSLYDRLIKELKKDEPIDKKRKARIQDMLINLNSLNHFYTRTRKKDVSVGKDFVTRKVKAINFEMNDNEKLLYDKGIYEIKKNNKGISISQIERKFTSSLFAENYLNEQINCSDSKYDALKECINTIEKSEKNNKKLIVFAFFKNTLLYLEKRLKNDGFKTGLIYGDKNITERNKILKEFSKGKFNILLSSEVGSTGLDLQFCDTIVNYDLPWNPMVIEQRIGRIDRIGQQSKEIKIFNFFYDNTIEQKIYKKLFERIKIFEESLGNLDEILGNEETYIEKAIHNLYKQDLTDEEIGKELDKIAQAIENNNQHLARINEELKDSFSNDFYFENEVKSIEQNKYYITENDLIELINRLIANCLTTCTFNKNNENSFEYILEQPKEFKINEFIEEHVDKGNAELKILIREFKNKNQNKKINCTFNQQYAFKNKDIEYISAYHPIINATANYFQKKNLTKNSVYRFALNKNEINQPEFNSKFKKGFYFLVRYEFEIEKITNKTSSVFTYLKSLVINLNGNEFSIISSEDCEFFSAICQQYKSSIPENGIIKFNKELVHEIKNIYSSFILNEKEDLRKYEEAKFISELTRKIKRELFDIEKRIERITFAINEGRGIETVYRKNLSDLEVRKNEILEKTQNSKLEINSKLISLNFIFLYG